MPSATRSTLRVRARKMLVDLSATLLSTSQLSLKVVQCLCSFAHLTTETSMVRTVIASSWTQDQRRQLTNICSSTWEHSWLSPSALNRRCPSTSPHGSGSNSWKKMSLLKTLRPLTLTRPKCCAICSSIPRLSVMRTSRLELTKHSQLFSHLEKRFLCVQVESQFK